MQSPHALGYQRFRTHQVRNAVRLASEPALRACRAGNLVSYLAIQNLSVHPWVVRSPRLGMVSESEFQIRLLRRKNTPEEYKVYRAGLFDPPTQDMSKSND